MHTPTQVAPLEATMAPRGPVVAGAVLLISTPRISMHCNQFVVCPRIAVQLGQDRVGVLTQGRNRIHPGFDPEVNGRQQRADGAGLRRAQQVDRSQFSQVKPLCVHTSAE